MRELRKRFSGVARPLLRVESMAGSKLGWTVALVVIGSWTSAGAEEALNTRKSSDAPGTSSVRAAAASSGHGLSVLAASALRLVFTFSGSRAGLDCRLEAQAVGVGVCAPVREQSRTGFDASRALPEAVRLSRAYSPAPTVAAAPLATLSIAHVFPGIATWGPAWVPIFPRRGGLVVAYTGHF